MTIVLPVFNDWAAASLLLPNIDNALADLAAPLRILLIDDGSTTPLPARFGEWNFQRIEQVDILRLRRNLGHQRAIAVALVYVYQHVPAEFVVVMDADGEDRPEDVAVLLRESVRENRSSIIFAARARRMETVAFQFFYRGYQLLHWLLTGTKVQVGNFSVIPTAILARLVIVSELWNHYAAAVFRARLPCRAIPLSRGRRLAGKSRLNFIGLVGHGLSAISVFGDVVAVRLLAVTSGSAVLLLLLMVAVVVLRWSTRLAIPGWATSALGILLILFSQVVLISLFLCFVIISARSNTTVIPLRDAPVFVHGVDKVFPADG
ncbi:MAG TPA: glycosyltransferase [bacterium]|nr:glycosyltransferase [bacterium]